jgi:hypothetical protein
VPIGSGKSFHGRISRWPMKRSTWSREQSDKADYSSAAQGSSAAQTTHKLDLSEGEALPVNHSLTAHCFKLSVNHGAASVHAPDAKCLRAGFPGSSKCATKYRGRPTAVAPCWCHTLRARGREELASAWGCGGVCRVAQRARISACVGIPNGAELFLNSGDGGVFLAGIMVT